VLLHEPRGPAEELGLVGEERRAGGSQRRFLWEAWRLARARRHDRIFFDHVGLAQLMKLPLPGLFGRPYDVFVHGTELVAAQSGRRAAALAGARCILANSEFTAGTVRALGVADPGRIRVVPLCIDPARIAGWEAAPPEPEPEREPAALIVGRMVAEERGKGHDALLEAWPALRLRRPDARLWVVGGGDDAARLEARAAELGVADCVEFLGRISDAELRDRYRRAAVFAMPSRQEGFGLVYAEAMWHGLPCIGATADAAASVIVEGETGRLVTWGDVSGLARALADLLGDPEARARLGEAGRRRAREHFAYPRFSRDVLAALDVPVD
jgi:phosphatidylinositol alpha-1,6-mannosyltransferase